MTASIQTERDQLASYIAQSAINCGRGHGRLVAAGLEADLSLTYEPGELWTAAERVLADRVQP